MKIYIESTMRLKGEQVLRIVILNCLKSCYLVNFYYEARSERDVMKIYIENTL